MELVPFDPAWVFGKADLHAIYRRPNGDLTTGLPVRRHLDWSRKGFEWVTLADADSLLAAANSLRAQGLDPRRYVVDPRTNSPWSYEAYVAAGYAGPPPSVEPVPPPAPKVVAPKAPPKRRGRKRRLPPPVAPMLSGPEV